VETIKSYKMKCEDYFPLQATYAQLPTPRVGPMLMFKTEKGAEKFKRRKHMMCVPIEHSFQSLSHTNLLFLTLASFNSNLSLKFMEEARLPNGLPPFLDIGGKRNHSKEIFHN